MMDIVRRLVSRYIKIDILINKTSLTDLAHKAVANELSGGRPNHWERALYQLSNQTRHRQFLEKYVFDFIGIIKWKSCC